MAADIATFRVAGKARRTAPTTLEQEELRGISRTVAEIHWLLLILVLLYLVFGGTTEDAEVNAAVSSGLFFYAALVMSFRYANFYRRETRWKIAIETWGMIAFITWVLRFSEGLANPLLNLYLLGLLDPARHDVTGLVAYVHEVSEVTGVPIHPSHPLSGRDAFRTATGVHAAAVIKAERLGNADEVYSSVPAHIFGRHQEIEVGHYSGRSNVIRWLEAHGVEASDEVVDRVLAHAKQQDHTLTEEEIRAVLS